MEIGQEIKNKCDHLGLVVDACEPHRDGVFLFVSVVVNELDLPSITVDQRRDVLSTSGQVGRPATSKQSSAERTQARGSCCGGVLAASNYALKTLDADVCAQPQSTKGDFALSCRMPSHEAASKTQPHRNSFLHDALWDWFVWVVRPINQIMLPA